MEVRFDDSGLVPCMAQDWRTGEVLTLAYMNEEALARTRESGDVWFFSRSRNELWHKGETSGNFLRLKALRYDCDLDAVLALVEPEGPACHTGERTCFHNGDADVRGAARGAAGARADGRGAAHGRRRTRATQRSSWATRRGSARRCRRRRRRSRVPRRTRATTASPRRLRTCSTTSPCCSPRAGSSSAMRSRRSMAVAADTANLEISPSLDEVRELARDHTLVPLRHTFIDDCETPVSAYLKLRGAGPELPARVRRAGPAVRALVVPRRAAAERDPARRRGHDRRRRSRASSTTRTRPSPRSSRATSSPSCRTCRRSRAARSGCSATTSSAGSSRPSARRTRTTSASPTWR